MEGVVLQHSQPAGWSVWDFEDAPTPQRSSGQRTNLQEPLVASLLLVVRPGAPSSFLLLVACLV